MAESLPTDGKVDFLICNQVRHDSDETLSLSQLSLLGYFAGAEISVDRAAKFPVNFPLGVLFVLKDGEGSYAAEFRVVNPGGVQIVTHPLPTIVKEPNKHHTIFLNADSFVAELPGRYTAVLTLGGRTYIRHFAVRQ